MVEHQTEERKSTHEWTRLDLIDWARHTDTTPTQLLILKAITDRVNLDLEQVKANDLACWPSYETLAADTHFSRRTISAAVNALRKKGLIVLGTEPVLLPGDKPREFVPPSLIFIIKPERGVQEVHTPHAAAAHPPVQEVHPPHAGGAHKVLIEEGIEEGIEEVRPDAKNSAPGTSPENSFSFSQNLKDPKAKTKIKAEAGTVLKPEVLSVGDTLSAAQGGRYDVTSPAPTQRRRQVGKILTAKERREARLEEQDEQYFKRLEEEERAKAGRKSA